MSSQGFGNSKPGSRTADASEVIRNMRIMAQVAADRTYSNNPKRNFNRTSAAVLATYSAPSSATGLNYVVGQSPVANTVQVCGGVSDSALFAGTASSRLTIEDDIDLRMEGDDFTIEWYQSWTGQGSFACPFSKGTASDLAVTLSRNSSTFYVIINGNATGMGTIQPNILVEWTHIALVRQGNTLTLYIDGVSISTLDVTGKTFTNTGRLTIGNQYTANSFSTFRGKIASFRWTKGTAVYTGNFTVPTSPLVALPNTKLLIQGITDQSCLSKIVNAVGVTVSTMTPF